MGRRKSTNEIAFGPLFPPSPMRLKEVPFENAERKPLHVCPDCRGSGERGTATKKEVSTSGVETDHVAKITGKDARKYKGLNGSGWLVDLKRCEMALAGWLTSSAASVARERVC